MELTGLELFWALALAFALLLYLVLDGFDLGVGILFGVTRDETWRRTMMKSIAPVWDGNETWLLVVGAGLYGAFPVVYAIVFSALYLPVVLLLVALVFRGVAFEFRYRATRHRWIWDWGFAVGSLVVAFVQGAAVGALIEGLPIQNGQYAGGAFTWLSPFAVFCGIGLVMGYTLHGANWLVVKTNAELRDWAYQRIPWLIGAVVVVLLAVFSYVQWANLDVAGRWQSISWYWIFPAIGVLTILGMAWGVRKRWDSLPFAMSALMFVAAFGALAVSFAPYMIPFSITIHDAASPEASLSFLFWGAGLCVLPVILIYTAVVYWIFRGKVEADPAEYP